VREIRLHSSEGGAPGITGRPYPYPFFAPPGLPERA